MTRQLTNTSCPTQDILSLVPKIPLDLIYQCHHSPCNPTGGSVENAQYLKNQVQSMSLIDLGNSFLVGSLAQSTIKTFFQEIIATEGVQESGDF